MIPVYIIGGLAAFVLAYALRRLTKTAVDALRFDASDALRDLSWAPGDLSDNHTDLSRIRKGGGVVNHEFGDTNA